VDASTYNPLSFLSLHSHLCIPLETQVSTIEAAFQEFTERKDIAILLINQHVGLLFGSERSAD